MTERLGRDLDTIPGVATLPPEPVPVEPFLCALCAKGRCEACDGFAIDREHVGHCRCQHWEVVG